MQLLECVRMFYNFTSHLKTTRFQQKATVTPNCTLWTCLTVSLLEFLLSAICDTLTALSGDCRDIWLVPTQGTANTKTMIHNQW